jgi:DNA repair ATPase RecN
MSGRMPINTSTLQIQIDGMGAMMKDNFAEMKEMLAGLDDRLRKIETREAEYQPMTKTRLDAAWSKIDGLVNTVGCQATDINNLGHKAESLKERMETVEKIVEKYGLLITEFAQTNKTLKWLTYILTAILIAILISFATGKATIAFH